MAKGQHLSAYQQKIVSRYYDNLDTIALQKLGETVSELFLASDEKKAAKLWASVETALKKTPLDKKRQAEIVAKRDIKALAEAVNRMSAK